MPPIVDSSTSQTITPYFQDLKSQRNRQWQDYSCRNGSLVCQRCQRCPNVHGRPWGVLLSTPLLLTALSSQLVWKSKSQALCCWWNRRRGSNNEFGSEWQWRLHYNLELLKDYCSTPFGPDRQPSNDSKSVYICIIFVPLRQPFNFFPLSSKTMMKKMMKIFCPANNQLIRRNDLLSQPPSSQTKQQALTILSHLKTRHGSWVGMSSLAMTHFETSDGLPNFESFPQNLRSVVILFVLHACMENKSNNHGVPRDPKTNNRKLHAQANVCQLTNWFEGHRDWWVRPLASWLLHATRLWQILWTTVLILITFIFKNLHQLKAPLKPNDALNISVMTVESKANSIIVMMASLLQEDSERKSNDVVRLSHFTALAHISKTVLQSGISKI